MTEKGEERLEVKLPGQRLKPSTSEVAKEDLGRQLAFQAPFVPRHFPEVAQRGRVEYRDIDYMTKEQADAMVYSLAKSVRSFKKGGHQRAVPGLGLLEPEEAEDKTDRYEIKAKQYVAALRDLCQVFGLESPLN